MYIKNIYRNNNNNTSSPRQEKLFIWPAPVFQYNKHLLRQNTGGSYLYMPQDAGHWLASFGVIPEQTVNTCPIFWVQNRQKKLFFKWFPI